MVLKKSDKHFVIKATPSYPLFHLRQFQLPAFNLGPEGNDPPHVSSGP